METGVRVQWAQDNGMGTPIEKMLILDPGPPLSQPCGPQEPGQEPGRL